MRILFFTPYFNQPRGNTTTSQRIVGSLSKLGIELRAVPYLEELWHSQQSPGADLIHILHATRFSSWADEQGIILDKPYIVTMGGTDINEDLQKNIDRSVYRLLDNASYITVFIEDSKKKILELNPAWGAKTVIIPQTVWFIDDLIKDADYDAPRILLPAGLRAVKDVLHAIPAIDRLVEEYPQLQFTIIGARLNEQVYREVLKAIHDRPWFCFVDAVPHERILEWYESHNVVINTSISEGQPLAVMEAMALGRPVIARRNKANENLVIHGETGWLYESMEQFATCLKTIMTDSTHREQVIINAKKQMTSSPLAEGKQYLTLYNQSLKRHP